MTSVVTVPSPAQMEDIAMFVASVTDRALVLVTLDGSISYWNEGAERLFDVVATQAIDSALDRFWAGSPQDLTSQDNATRRIEDWCCRGDGSEFMADITIAPVRTAAGEVRGYGLSIVDVTTRRGAERMVVESEAHMRSVLATDRKSVV